MSAPTTWEIVKDRSDRWIVGEGADTAEEAVKKPVAVFVGPDAEARARAYHASLTAPQAESATMCGASEGGWTCTLPSGHAGTHIATLADYGRGEECARWGNAPDWSTVGPQLVEALKARAPRKLSAWHDCQCDECNESRRIHALLAAADALKE